MVKHSLEGSADFEANLARLHPMTTVHWITESTDIPNFPQQSLVIDALLGSGLSRPTEGLLSEVIQKTNASSATIIAVDIALSLIHI